jgi:N-acetylglucosaminyldiphosphoundecaprenol N-acetyl-beta-D-mannosaminyltransferase
MQYRGENSQHTSESPKADFDDLSRARANVLGVGIHAINMAKAIDVIARAIEAGKRGYICVTGVHGVIEAQKDPYFRRILNEAFLDTPDGVPTVWVGKAQGFSEMSRVYGPDLMLEVSRMSVAKGYTHFLYGGEVGVAQELQERLTKMFPGIRIVGTSTPPFRLLTSDEEGMLIEKIRTLKPDVFWVGLGTPKQEKFMAEYIHKLDTRLMIGVGAAFDFHSGRVKQAPKWMQRNGLEWAFRLYQEPRRLWRRYLHNNPVFLLKIAGQMIGISKPSLT